MATTKMQFAVQMTCQNCVDSINKSLAGQPGITSFEVNLQNQQVLVESTLPSSQVQDIVEKTGRRAVLIGYGSKTSQRNLGAAVSILTSLTNIKGVTRFVQIDDSTCIIEGTVDGLSPGAHGLHIHELGDISSPDCSSCGDHFNPMGFKHGGPNDIERHAGDLGNIKADNNGRAIFILKNDQVKVSDIIGRSIVISEKEDDLGKGKHALSHIDGNSGNRVACGVIARSAGLFENVKKLCQCDGVTIWDERDKPAAGPGRRNP